MLDCHVSSETKHVPQLSQQNIVQQLVVEDISTATTDEAPVLDSTEAGQQVSVAPADEGTCCLMQ